MRTKTLSTLVAVVLSAGCGRPALTKGGRQVQQVGSANGCTFVGQVSGYVDWTGPAGERDAKVKALNEAAELGANAVVWVSVASGGIDSQAEGQAYKCE